MRTTTAILITLAILVLGLAIDQIGYEPLGVVYLDNGYGYPVAFDMPQGTVTHTDEGFNELAKHWNHNASQYTLVIVKEQLTLEEAKTIEKLFIKEE
jgi:hypothetical protein